MALPLICSGLRPRLPGREAVPGITPVGITARRLAGAALLALAALAAPSLPARAESPSDLLEPERAFALSARGLDPSTLEVRFAIAPGYYLYRDKLSFAVEPARLVRQPALPPGEVKQDPFFGRTETYRGEVVVRLPLASAMAGAEVALTADSQGCADAGVCYPAQRQRLVVTLPVAGAPPGALVEAAPEKRRWFP